jgi:hypothetical protein
MENSVQFQPAQYAHFDYLITLSAVNGTDGLSGTATIPDGVEAQASLGSPIEHDLLIGMPCFGRLIEQNL